MHQIINMLLTSWLSSCNVLIYVILIVCVSFPYGVLVKGCGIRIYRLLIIPFSSTLADLYDYLLFSILVAILDFDDFKTWHTGTIHHQNVNIKHK